MSVAFENRAAFEPQPPAHLGGIAPRSSTRWSGWASSDGSGALHWAAIWSLLVTILLLLAPQAPGTGSIASRSQASMAAAQLTPARAGTWVPSQDSWSEQLSKPSFWASRKAGGTSNWSPPSGLIRVQPNPWSVDPSRISLPSGKSGPKSLRSDDDDDGGSKSGRTYRTMCVRLCDGFFFPISFATTKDNFERDAVTCERQCGGASDARLFTYRNPGGEIDDMEDLDGKSYKRLQSAFLFRTKYDAQCKCRSHPWEDASTDRHKSYALNAAAVKGDPVAARELTTLKAKMQDSARTIQRDKQAQLRAKRDADMVILQQKADKGDKAARQTLKVLQAEDRKAGLVSPVTTASTSGAPYFVKVPGQRQPATSDRQAVDARGGTLPEPSVVPTGERSGVVILRYGGQPPIEVSVPANSRRRPSSAPRNREADANPGQATANSP